MAKIIKSADKGIRGFEKIFIEDPRRAWTIGIFLVIIIVLLVVFWSRIKGLFQSLVNKGGLNADLDEHITSTGETPTLSGVQFNLLANKLYNAMKGVGTDEDTVHKGIESEVEKTLLRREIDKLGKREKMIMEMRFGLNGRKEMTQKEVAQTVGISQSYISRLEKKTLKAIRENLEKIC